MRAIDYTGLRFGAWTVLEVAGRKRGHISWKCKCDCGTVRDLASDQFSSGSKSCGCVSQVNTRNRLTIHGMTGTRLFRVWLGMLSRCRNPNDASYKNYGGRGIKFDPRWLDFRVFYEEVGQSYISGYTIDRIDNDAGYFADNCRWVPLSAQSANRRKGALWELKDEPISTNTSGVRGVVQDKKSGRWVAHMSVNGRQFHLGSFETIEEAAVCYRSAKAKRRAA